MTKNAIRLNTEVGILYFVYILLLFIFTLVGSLFSLEVGLTLPHIVTFMTTIIFMIFTHTRPFFAISKFGVKDIIFVLCLIVPVYVISITLSTCMSFFVSDVMDQSSQDLVNLCNSHSVIELILMMAVLPAIVEEFVFRGALYGIFKMKSVLSGMVVSAICFSLVHMDVLNLLPTLFMGFIFVFVREITGSIYCSMLLHVLFNSTSLLLTVYGQNEYVSKFVRMDFGVLLFLCLISIVFIVFFIRRSMIKKSIQLKAYDNKGVYVIAPAGVFVGWFICFIMMILMFCSQTL